MLLPWVYTSFTFSTCLGTVDTIISTSLIHKLAVRCQLTRIHVRLEGEPFTVYIFFANNCTTVCCWSISDTDDCSKAVAYRAWSRKSFCVIGTLVRFQMYPDLCMFGILPCFQTSSRHIRIQIYPGIRCWSHSIRQRDGRWNQCRTHCPNKAQSIP